ncbi:hypothetical protein H072_2658 [Dactylellina haptotyla CBS 200.50]|uniref:F-box domain-containing protein n=1 Tax=Dactylellina haptotyla (strain CBS 200.50) TaxID=1284197 RepID=S8AKH8_DACHA|nr:hypothetical protein H072_2658 [Dactylellina haptotyla CBS 200.50]
MDTDSGVSCSLCGVALRLERYRGLVTNDLWILHPKITGHAYGPDTSWTKGEFVGCIGAIRYLLPDSPRPQIEIRDANLGYNVTLGSEFQFGRATETRYGPLEVPPKPCYPIHNGCWELLKLVAKKLGMDQTSSFQNRLYQILNAAAYDGSHLLWPHNYDLSSEELVRTQAGRRYHNNYEDTSYMDSISLQCLESLRVRNPLADHPYFVDQTEVLDKHDLTLNIPDFLPLPLEITHKVLSFLPGSEIVHLNKIKSNKTLQVPDYIWKSQFQLGGELGFVIDPRFSKDKPGTLWYPRYLFAKEALSESPLASKNLKRRWGIFSNLVHKIIDTDYSIPCNISPFDNDEDIESRSKFLDGLYYQDLEIRVMPQRELEDDLGPLLCDGVKTISYGDVNVQHFQTTGVNISYTGEGRLRFISGFQFQPGNEIVGLINSNDSVYVSFRASSPTLIVLWIARSNYGIHSILTSELGYEPVFPPIDSLSVTRRFLETGPDGIKVTDFYIGMGTSEITELGIRSPQIKDREGLERQEWFIQSYSWSPNVPPVFSNRYIEIDHYSFCGGNIYTDKSLRRYAPPLQYILFAEEKITRFGCWFNFDRQICGIGFFPKETDTPLIIGTSTKLSMDVVLEENDILTSIDFVTEGLGGPVVGLTVHSTSGEVFHFLLSRSNPSRKNRKNVLSVESGRQIAGIFGGFWDEDNPRNPRLTALGIITSHRKTPPTTQIKPNTVGRAGNPVFQIEKTFTDGTLPRELVPNLNDPFLTSSATLYNCSSIDCYILEDQFDSQITGLGVHYGEDTEIQNTRRRPATLGRICGRKLMKSSFDVQTDQGEYITAVNVFIKKIYVPRFSKQPIRVIGMVFWTSTKRKMSFGKCDVEYATKVIYMRTNIENDLAIKWIYSEDFDYVLNWKDA